MTDFDPTTEWTPPTETEVAAIRDYFDRGSARAHEIPSPLFSGRDALVDSIRGDLLRLRNSPTPLPSLTWTVYGGPGAGKSEVLLHLAAEFSQWTEGESPVRVVRGTKAILTDPVALGEAVYTASGLDPDKLTDELVRREYGGSIQLAKASAMYERRARRSATAMGRTARAVNRECGAPTILLLVDEAQKKLVGTSDLPLEFHEGNTPLKVLPVYGGLGDTLARLGDAGISRLDEGHERLMEPLTGRIAGDMCRRALWALTNPPDKDPVDRWAVEIVSRCEGWPMHLTHCFLAVRERQRAAPDRTFTDEDFDRAMGRADTLRRDYYDRRLNTCRELSRSQYTAWAALFGQGGDVWPETIKAHPVLGARRTEGRSDLVEGALRAGLVESKTDGTLRSPIPSLVDHIARRGRRFEQSFGQFRDSGFGR